MMAMGLAELNLSPAAILTSRIHRLPKESEKSRRFCLQTPCLKIRSFSSFLRASQAASDHMVGSGQDFRSKFATPITISSRRGRRSKCVPKGNEVSVVTGESNVNTKMPMSMPTLEVYGTNMTKLAEQGKLYLAAVGRQDPVELVVQILCLQTNPVLLGGYRVGKISIVEGLAQRIATGDVPDAMKGKKVIKLEMSLLLAGTKHHAGELEERLKKLIVEIKQSDEIILFIDEVHFLSGAGASEGAIAAAAANILKPAIARGELKWCIGAMTFDEYRNHFQILETRFLPVIVPEPSLDDTIEILKGLQLQQEENLHQVGYTMEALFSAVQLSYRHLPFSYSSDEIFSIDQADSHVRVRNPQLLDEAREEAREALKELRQITKSMNEVVCGQDIKELHEREFSLWFDIAFIVSLKVLKMGSGLGLSTLEIIAIVISWTGIPIPKASLVTLIDFLKMKRFFISLSHLMIKLKEKLMINFCSCSLGKSWI